MSKEKGQTGKMTEKRLNELMRLWQHRLGLDLWDLELAVEPCTSEHSFMEIHRSRAYNAAKIFVQPWLLTGEIPPEVLSLTLTNERIEAKVVHELIHCYTAKMRGLVEDRLEGLLHRDVFTLFLEVFEDAEESTIEGLAQALVRAFSQEGG